MSRLTQSLEDKGAIVGGSHIGKVPGTNLDIVIYDEPNIPQSQSQQPNTPQKCGVICQKKKKRKVLLIGVGVLLVGGISYFILKKK